MDADRGISVGEVCGPWKPMSQQGPMFSGKYVFRWLCVVLFVCGYVGNGKTLLLIVLMMEFRLQYWALKSKMFFR